MDKIFVVYSRNGKDLWCDYIEEILTEDLEPLPEFYCKEIRAFIALLALLETKVNGQNKSETLESFIRFKQASISNVLC